jgi:O-antigen/teichoic acid export membrane protein
MPILTRLLTPGAYGTAAMAMTLCSFISAAALAGADISYIRAYHAKQTAPGEAVEAFTWRYSIAGAILAAVAVEAFWGPLANIFSLPFYAGWLVSASIVLCVAMTMATARARLQNRNVALSIATACAGLGSVAASIALAYAGWHNELPLLIGMAATFLIPVLILGVPPPRLLLKPSGLSPAVRRHIFGIGAAAVITAPAYSIMALSDRWFLSYYLNADAAGIYSVAYSVAIVGMTVNAAGLYVWTPEATRLFESRHPNSIQQLGTITEAMIAVLAWVWLAVAAAGGDIIRLFAAPAFHVGAAVVPLIAGSIFFHGIGHLANTVYILEKRVHRSVWWWGAGAAASLLLNAVLIPYAGMRGAAAGQLLAFAITALGLSFNARRMLSEHLSWMRILLVLFTVLAAAFAIVPAWHEAPLVSLLLKLPAVLLIALIIASYFGAASILREVLAGTGGIRRADPVTVTEPVCNERSGH